ncbi:hypothetical protein ZIOFF_035234 [Zingiber officinale]|uniref:Transducin/WD40 repeat-like superfamily protein n=1 Tax=Zingiber officinale TaxID=94328 RepID=A0A8J5L6Z0_ZINOF|nr:hypothetical protein ZIOFF_035234 [Zingiber officinale]
MREDTLHCGNNIYCSRYADMKEASNPTLWRRRNSPMTTHNSLRRPPSGMGRDGRGGAKSASGGGRRCGVPLRIYKLDHRAVQIGAPEGDGGGEESRALLSYDPNHRLPLWPSVELTRRCGEIAIELHTLSSILRLSNPVARWRICQSSINNLSFSSDGTCLATVSRDGYLRVFDFAKEQLKFGGKSYYGALLCCAWSVLTLYVASPSSWKLFHYEENMKLTAIYYFSLDGKYILTGGEDDLVQVWSTEDRKIVAWGEGHNSWVSGVAFDSYWSAPNSEGNGENVVYRFGSVGQDTQLLLWDLAMDEIALPLRGPPGGSPTFASRSHSVHWDSVIPAGSLQPAPSMQDVPKISPLVAHRVHVDPLSGVIFTNESIVTISREAHIKIWMRPGHSDNSQSNSPDAVAPIAILKDKPVVASSIKTSGSSYKQPTSVIFS